MKKILLFVSFLSLFSFCKAQSDKLEIGILGGPNDVFIYEHYPIINVAPLYNYRLGVSGQYNFTDIFAICTEINLERKGFAQDLSSVINPASPDPIITTSNPTNLDYVTLPVMAKVSLGKTVKFYIKAGPYFGYMVGARSKITLTDSSGNERNSTFNMISNYKHFDFGAGGGFGVEIPIMSKLILSLEGKLDYGFLDIGYPFSTDPPTKNESADLILSLRYRL